LIFGGRQPPLNENSPELRAVKTIFNRYNEVSETLADRPQVYRPIFMIDDDGSIVARDWAIGFALGIGLRPKQWGRASCLPTTARCWSRSWSIARASLISCRK
jgi:yecA family protein